jgi:SAM-dependent methyltransferase
MGFRKSVARLLLGRRRADALSLARILRSPDRAVLLERYMPPVASAAGRILWVGCKPYTADYSARLQGGGGEVWTTDIDPAAEQWGAAGRHRTGDIREADRLFAGQIFDAILCNGVLGFGVDTRSDQARTLDALAAILRPGGLLLLGWNTDRIADPIAAGLTAGLYEPAPLDGQPARFAVPGVTHVYDTLRRRPLPGA